MVIVSTQNISCAFADSRVYCKIPKRYICRSFQTIQQRTRLF